MKADPVQLSMDQFIGAWRLMCSGSSRRSAAREDNVEMVFSGVPVPFFRVREIYRLAPAARSEKGPYVAFEHR